MSEAAKPADPERALAELERLHFQVADATTPRERDRAASSRAVKLIEGCGWLLPLARAGLSVQLEADAVRAAVRFFAQENVVDLGDPDSRATLKRDHVQYVLPWRIEEEEELIAAVLRSPEPATKPRPKVVVFCGSSRFVAQMAVLMWEYEKAGRIAMGLHLLPAEAARRPDGSVIDHHLAEEQGVAAQMDELHLRKIDLADEVFVVNVGGYIGDSSRREIAYATAHGKRVVYLEDAAPEPATPADGGA